MRRHRKNARILATIFLIAVTIIGVDISNTVIVTTAELLCVRSNISMYNESRIKTDKKTSEVLKEFETRKALYENEDDIVSGFASRNPVVKIVILAAAIMFYPAIIYMWSVFIISRRYAIEKRQREQRKRERKARLQQKYRNRY